MLTTKEDLAGFHESFAFLLELLLRILDRSDVLELAILLGLGVITTGSFYSLIELGFVLFRHSGPFLYLCLGRISNEQRKINVMIMKLILYLSKK